nr:hypothetical protein CFP56_19616 [Quercus suber]
MSLIISKLERTIVTIHHRRRCHNHPAEFYGHVTRFWSSYDLGRANIRFRTAASTRKIRDRLFGFLDQVDLRNLRLASRVLCRVIQDEIAALFRTVYVHPSGTGNTMRWEGFETVADSVRHLVVVIGASGARGRKGVSSESLYDLPSTHHGKNRDAIVPCNPSISYGTERYAGQRVPGPSPLHVHQSPFGKFSQRGNTAFREKSGLRDQLRHILTKTCSLRKLTVQIDAPCPWAERTEIENNLLDLRETLEAKADVSLPHLIEFRLIPTHTLGIIHLNWQGLGSLCSAGSAISIPEFPTSNIWTRLTKLTIHIPNPDCEQNLTDVLTSAQTKLFFRSLYHYLRAFTPTLQQLTFIWLGTTPGPCPLAFHLHSRSAEWQALPLHWSSLTKLRVGNITLLQQSVDLADQLAPGLNVLQVMRSSVSAQPRRASSPAAEEGEGWVDVLPSHRADIHGDVRIGDVSQLGKELTTWLAPLERIASRYPYHRPRSSVYSFASTQYVDGMRPITLTEQEEQVDGEVSRSSRDVPIMLGFSPEWTAR